MQRQLREQYNNYQLFWSQVSRQMASQPVASAEQSVTEIESFVRGYHEYKDIWQPRIGEVLVLKREPTNDKDRLAVSIERQGQVVGHVPCNLAPLISYFLLREVNKGMVEMTGQPVNRGAGMGMEVPCVYHLFGPRIYLKRLEEVIKNDFSSVKLREK